MRDVIIIDKMWTYCANFTHALRDNDIIRGPIFAAGLYEGYVRIPWLGDRRPKTVRSVKCFDCGDHVESGIEIELRSGEKYGFCCNKNYVRWWNTKEADYRWWQAKEADYQRMAPSTEGLKGCPKESGRPVNTFVTKLDRAD